MPLMEPASSPKCSPVILIGCAGWNVPKDAAAQFPAEGTHLQRYAARLPAVEINSSFYRPHRRSTYEKWSSNVPADFRFSVKVPKSITHEQRLKDANDLLDRFLDEVSGLGEKLGCLLVQLPPSLELDMPIAANFFSMLSRRLQAMLRVAQPVATAIVCEPRHPSWFTRDGEELLASHGIARVAADPAPVPGAAQPGGSRDAIYYRLHGSPRIYYSAYDESFLTALAAALKQYALSGRRVWCLFDNTALGAAAPNALGLLRRVTNS